MKYMATSESKGQAAETTGPHDPSLVPLRPSQDRTTSAFTPAPCRGPRDTKPQPVLAQLPLFLPTK